MSTALIPAPVNYALPENSAALNLNPRQIAFVDRSLELRVGWKAARQAGYSGGETQLSAAANQLLKNPKVQAYYLERLQGLQVSADETLAEVGQIARSPWEKHVAVKYGDNGEVIQAQLRLQDKLKALELAGKYHRLFADRVETESSLTDSDIARLSESLVNGLMEVARRRQQAALPAVSSGDTLDGE